MATASVDRMKQDYSRRPLLTQIARSNLCAPFTRSIRAWLVPSMW